MPYSNPCVPYANPYVIRAWDVRENEPQTVLGTDQSLRQYYNIPVPSGAFQQFSGTLDQWQNGVSYATWLAGGYTKNCPNWNPSMVNSVVCTDGSLIISPTTGNVVAAINPAHHNVWLTSQYIFVNDGSVPLKIGTNLPVGPGRVLVQFFDSVGSQNVVIEADGVVEVFGKFVAEMDISTYNNAFEVTQSSAIQFAIDNAGNILTNNATTSYVPGALVKVLPISDATGAMIGVTPIYTATTALTVSIEEDFTSFAGTPLGGTAASPTDVPGNNWIDAQGGPWGTGTLQRLNQIGTMLTLGSNLAVATIDSTHADCTIIGTLVHSGLTTTTQVGLVFRQADTSNYLILYVGPSGIVFGNVIGGSFSAMYTVPGSFLAGSYPFEVQLLGATAYVTIGPYFFTVPLLPFSSETKHGFYVGASVLDTASGCSDWKLVH